MPLEIAAQVHYSRLAHLVFPVLLTSNAVRVLDVIQEVLLPKQTKGEQPTKTRLSEARHKCIVEAKIAKTEVSIKKLEKHINKSDMFEIITLLSETKHNA